MTRPAKTRKRSPRDIPSPPLDLEPVLHRTLRLLENSPRGASRVDILAALNLQTHAWPPLREALEETGEVVAVGRGPGLRHVHARYLDQVPPEVRAQVVQQVRGTLLNEARTTLREMIRDQAEIGSVEAQEATGLRADPVRRLLLELVDEGVVERSGKKRSTRYRWVG